MRRRIDRCVDAAPPRACPVRGRPKPVRCRWGKRVVVAGAAPGAASAAGVVVCAVDAVAVAAVVGSGGASAAGAVAGAGAVGAVAGPRGRFACGCTADPAGLAASRGTAGSSIDTRDTSAECAALASAISELSTARATAARLWIVSPSSARMASSPGPRGCSSVFACEVSAGTVVDVCAPRPRTAVDAWRIVAEFITPGFAASTLAWTACAFRAASAPALAVSGCATSTSAGLASACALGCGASSPRASRPMPTVVGWGARGAWTGLGAVCTSVCFPGLVNASGVAACKAPDCPGRRCRSSSMLSPERENAPAKPSRAAAARSGATASAGWPASSGSPVTQASPSAATFGTNPPPAASAASALKKLPIASLATVVLRKSI